MTDAEAIQQACTQIRVLKTIINLAADNEMTAEEFRRAVLALIRVL
jgi:hypothetical protein